MSPVVFLDKDGTLIEDVPFNTDMKRIRWMKGVPEGLSLLAAAGFFFIIVSNQPGIALGRFKEERIKIVHKRLKAMMAELNAVLLGLYYCPHHPQGTVLAYTKVCDCRKPRPGLLHRAAQEHGVDLASSWLVGDILDDVEAGNRAGMRSILLNNGHETLWQIDAFRTPSAIVADLQGAATHILEENSKKDQLYVGKLP